MFVGNQYKEQEEYFEGVTSFNSCKWQASIVASDKLQQLQVTSGKLQQFQVTSGKFQVKV